jgi:hypothetical protein
MRYRVRITCLFPCFTDVDVEAASDEAAGSLALAEAAQAADWTVDFDKEGTDFEISKIEEGDDDEPGVIFKDD